MNEFELEEQKAYEASAERERKRVDEQLDKLLTKLEDVEHTQIALEEVIKEVTPSDDLETVKMRLNQLISTINSIAV